MSRSIDSVHFCGHILSGKKKKKDAVKPTMIDFKVMFSIAETQEMPVLLQKEENSAGMHVRVVNPSLRCYVCSKCL
jgi:hypothetical protein